MENTAAAANPEQQQATKLPKVLLRYLKYIFLGFLLWLFIRTFFFQPMHVPSASMENTLQPGDYILVNKLAYGPRLPMTLFSLPVSGSKTFLDWIEFPYGRIPGYSDVKRNDVIVFNLPAETDVPVDMRSNYVKRCIALPGDTIKIAAGEVFVNGKKIENPPGAIIPARTLSPGFDPNVFPNNPKIRWNADNFGPLLIPKKGMTIALDASTISIYKNIISNEEKNNLVVRNDSAFIDKIFTPAYTFKSDYFFVLGDNRNNSEDSRFWGFVPRSHLIGKASLILNGSRSFSSIN